MTIMMKSIREQLGIEVTVGSSCSSAVSLVIPPEPYEPDCLSKNKISKYTKNDTECVTSNTHEKSFLNFVYKAFSMTDLVCQKKQKKPHGTVLFRPTPIQLQVWSVLTRENNSSDSDTVHQQQTNIHKQHDHHDDNQETEYKRLIAIAPTGSGKTLSYTLPFIFSYIQERQIKNKHNNPIQQQSHEDIKYSGGYVHSLILVPTRELAIQIHKVISTICTKVVPKFMELNTIDHDSKYKSGKVAVHHCTIYGGTNRQEQIQELLSWKTGGFLTATTGRLIDLLGLSVDGENAAKEVNQEQELIQKMFLSVHTIIIDEADRMVINTDISKQVDAILNLACHRRWTCLFSATMPQKVIEKYQDWVGEPYVSVKVNVLTVGNMNQNQTQQNITKCDGDSDFIEGNEKEEEKDTHLSTTQDTDLQLSSNKRKSRGPLDLSAIPKNITQILHVCSQHKKPKKLITTIQKIRKEEQQNRNSRHKSLILIFFAKIKTLQYISQFLNKESIKVCMFHSQMSQDKREMALNMFRSGKCPIMLSTDIAARGLHVKNVEYIVNYDFPCSLEQYIHRCGRAARDKIQLDNVETNSKESPTAHATVYSFFHREIAPMATDVIQLLRSCDAWIDPNLISLVEETTNSVVSDTADTRKRKRRKRKADGSTKPTQNISTDQNDLLD